eukprot:g41303.t1
MEGHLRECLESVDWSIFKNSEANLNRYATTNTDFISKCVENYASKNDPQPETMDEQGDLLKSRSEAWTYTGNTCMAKLILRPRATKPTPYISWRKVSPTWTLIEHTTDLESAQCGPQSSAGSGEAVAERHHSNINKVDPVAKDATLMLMSPVQVVRQWQRSISPAVKDEDQQIQRWLDQ